MTLKVSIYPSFIHRSSFDDSIAIILLTMNVYFIGSGNFPMSPHVRPLVGWSVFHTSILLSEQLNTDTYRHIQIHTEKERGRVRERKGENKRFVIERKREREREREKETTPRFKEIIISLPRFQPCLFSKLCTCRLEIVF